MILREGAIAGRMLEDGREAAVYPMIYTFRLCVGLPRDFDTGYDDAWCYHDAQSALDAMNNWNGVGEPEGWHRHPMSGRRREEGNPAAEYVMR